MFLIPFVILMKKIYICIDLKSFYASVECMERGLDPLNTNLVVADSSRTEKTICLAVSPSLKKLGIPGRARLFEVVQKVREVNDLRKKKNRGRRFNSKSYLESEYVKMKINQSIEYMRKHAGEKDCLEKAIKSGRIAKEFEMQISKEKYEELEKQYEQ